MRIITVLSVFTIFILSLSCSKAPTIEGDLYKWEPVVLTFDGPELKEKSSTFRDYRLDVVFTNGEKEYTIPGYFAADGNAANTGASKGNKWRVKFTPNTEGKWKYKVSFRTGENIAAIKTASESTPLEFDGSEGSFLIKGINPKAKGCFAKGNLLYTGERYLQFSETKEWFIKAGPGGPENFLGYADFDSTYNVPGGISTDSMLGDNRLHEYMPHLADWNPGDPTWKDGKGKGIIGTINYLAEKGQNNLYMVTNNVEGDGRDCWPWTSYDDRDKYDVSKLDQWDIVFNYMNQKGIEVNFYLWEAENDKLLNGGDMGIERQIYYREIIARFGYLPAIRYNIAEEPQMTSEQVLANAEFIKSIEPYGKAVGVHCGYTIERRQEELPPLYGSEYINGAWMQIHADHHNEILKYLNGSEENGYKWVVSVDEPQPIYTHNNETARRIFWEVVTAGGEGFDVYFGYGGGTCDIANEDFRNRDTMWSQLAIGLELFYRPEINAVLPEMKNHDELGNGYILAKPGELYIIYLNNEESTIDLGTVNGIFEVKWLDPVLGGELSSGTVNTIEGGDVRNYGKPLFNGNEYVAIIQKVN